MPSSPTRHPYQPLGEVIPYITKDGSVIRELMHPSVHSNDNQSLAEATIPVGVKTLMHVHRVTEELYHITQGEGLMHLAGDAFMVRSGDTICIPPESPHCIENRGSVPLILLCCCSPAYSHDDTFIM